MCVTSTFYTAVYEDNISLEADYEDGQIELAKKVIEKDSPDSGLLQTVKVVSMSK